MVVSFIRLGYETVFYNIKRGTTIRKLKEKFGKELPHICGNTLEFAISQKIIGLDDPIVFNKEPIKIMCCTNFNLLIKKPISKKGGK